MLQYGLRVFTSVLSRYASDLDAGLAVTHVIPPASVRGQEGQV